MKLFLIEKIRKYFYSDSLKSINDDSYKALLEEIWNLKPKDGESTDYILRKKSIITHHFEAFFKYADLEKRKNEIEKALKIIDEISDN